MTLSGYWLLLMPLVPMLVALILMIRPGMRRGALTLAPWCALPALVLALLPWDFASTRLPGLLLGTQVGLDDAGRFFLLLCALVWLVGGLHASKPFARPESPGFFICFLLAMAGNLGVIIAGGVLSFYFSFALMSFAAYGLVIHDRSRQALRAGRIYMVFVVLGEVLLLSALMLAANEAQGYDFETIHAAVAESGQRDLILLLIIMGLGTKIGLPGLHFALPLIYRAAPAAAAAVLAGAMINAGLLGWLRLLPLGYLALVEWGAVLITLGLFAAFYGVLIGLTQRDAKTLLAYSSISQMGILTIAVGLGLSAPQTWSPQLLMVTTLYAVHHGLAKATLFLGLEVAQRCPDTRYWRWLVGTGLLLPALALAGAPLTSGMLAKVLLKAQVDLAPSPWESLLGWLLPLSSLATTLLVARFLYLAWPRPDSTAINTAPKNLPSWAVLLAASLLLVWFLPHSMEVKKLASFSVWWQSLWPVLAGTVIAAIAARRFLYRKIPIPEIPPGDLLVLVQPMIQGLIKALTGFTATQLPRWQAQIMSCRTSLIPRIDWHKYIAAVEAGLTRWPVATILFVLLVLAMALPQLLFITAA